jgi:alkylation response protein AidB-like acyl-CoA dehydrogenase
VDAEVVELAGRLRDVAPAELFSETTWRQCAAVGLTGLPVDQGWGGRSATLAATATTFEAFARAGAPPGLVFALGAQQWSVTSPIARFGSGAQQARWLPGLCDGTIRGGHAMTESTTGSDAFAMATTAVERDACIVLDGSKTFITNGPHAGLFIVFATSDRALGWAGVSAHLVERGTAGFAVGPAIRVMSAAAAPLAELSLDACAVPIDQRVGRAGNGLAVFTHAMELERSLLAAGLIGLSLARLEEVTPMSDRGVELHCRARVARLLLQRAAARLDAGRAAPRESCLAKLAASELWAAVATEVAERRGAAGMLEATGIDLADAAAGSIYSGTSEMQREMLGRRLGL